MAVRELVFNEGKDYLLNNALVGKTVYGLLSTKRVIGCLLTAPIVALPQATIPVDDTTDFPATGSFVLYGNTVSYTGKTATTFTGCTGGTGAVADNALCLGTTGFVVTDTLAGGALAEITGAGYSRKTQVVPASSNGIIAFAAFIWNPASATNWSASVYSFLLASASGSVGSILYASSLASPDSLALANTEFEFTPTFWLQNIGGGQ